MGAECSRRRRQGKPLVAPRLHPADPIKRARNRAWTDFAPDFSKALNAIGYAKTKTKTKTKTKAKEEVAEGVANAPKALLRLELALATERGNDGPYFNRDTLCLVDAAYAPFLQRFGLVEELSQTGLLKDFPLVQAWSDALMANETVTGAVYANFQQEYVANHRRRETYVSSLMRATGVAAA